MTWALLVFVLVQTVFNLVVVGWVVGHEARHRRPAQIAAEIIGALGRVTPRNGGRTRQ